jgi:hypothetical protein
MANSGICDLIDAPIFRGDIFSPRSSLLYIPLALTDYFRVASDELNILQKNMVRLVYYRVVKYMKKNFKKVWGAKPINKE